jgi:hypothetical protein
MFKSLFGKSRKANANLGSIDMSIDGRFGGRKKLIDCIKIDAYTQNIDHEGNSHKYGSEFGINHIVCHFYFEEYDFISFWYYPFDLNIEEVKIGKSRLFTNMNYKTTLMKKKGESEYFDLGPMWSYQEFQLQMLAEENQALIASYLQSDH